MIRKNVIVIGAGAAGLMCALEAAKRGRDVLVLDHANKAGKKILMSGGGRCNFTNLHVEPDNFISNNPHFCKSALRRFTQWHFIAMVEHHGIAYHERSHGQLFCNHSSKDILNMLLSECRDHGVAIQLQTTISAIETLGEGGFRLLAGDNHYHCQALVIATGGLSIPKMGASAFGYKVAEQFGIPVRKPYAGLVPLTWREQDKPVFEPLAGIAVDARVTNPRQSFRENVLFTHRGLSGPAILQISSYWRPGETIQINWLPDRDVEADLQAAKNAREKQTLKNVLSRYLPKRMVTAWYPSPQLDTSLHALAQKDIATMADRLQAWGMTPNGTEGYRTAEVTVGGVDCDHLSSKTMETKAVPGLYFIGEVVDVTGWLGGYNFQWAWSSGWCAGQAV